MFAIFNIQGVSIHIEINFQKFINGKECIRKGRASSELNQIEVQPPPTPPPPMFKCRTSKIITFVRFLQKNSALRLEQAKGPSDAAIQICKVKNCSVIGEERSLSYNLIVILKVNYKNKNNFDNKLNKLQNKLNK